MCVTVRTLCLLVSSVSVILSVGRAVIHDMLHPMVHQGCDSFQIIPQSHKMVTMSVPHLDAPLSPRLPLSPTLPSPPHTHTHARTHPRTHAPTHPRTHAHAQGRRLPFRAAETDPHGLACSENHRDSVVAACFLVVDALFCRSCLLCPLLFSTGAHGSDSAEFVEFPQSLVVDVAVFMQRQVVSRQSSPQTQFIAGVSGHFSRPQRQVRTVSAVHGGLGGDEG